MQLLDTERAYENDRATMPCHCENTIPVEEFANVRKDLVPTRDTGAVGENSERVTSIPIGKSWGVFFF